jgi:hypothetical protein
MARCYSRGYFFIVRNIFQQRDAREGLQRKALREERAQAWSVKPDSTNRSESECGREVWAGTLKKSVRERSV